MANTEVANARCPVCLGMLALIGRVHRCIPRDPIEVGIPATPPKPKLSGGAVVKSSRGGVETQTRTAARVAQTGGAAIDLGSGTLRGMAPEPVAGVATGPREAKLRAKPGSKTYVHRDPEQRRAYQRDLMRKRRTKAPAV